MVPTLSPRIAILTGPTASGKTEIALSIARRCPAIEIINADSILVYRGFDVGSAKPDAETLREIPHHLVDIQDATEAFTLGDFHRLATQAIADIHSRGKRALIVGGTGFYFQSLLYGLWEGAKGDPEIRRELELQDNSTLFSQLNKIDQESALRIGQNDRYRLLRALEAYQVSGKTPSELEALTPKEPNPQYEVWGVDRDNDVLFERLRQRTRAMLGAGFIDEVKALRARFPEARALKSVGYLQVCNFLDGITPQGRKIDTGMAGLEEEILLATRQLIKRQRTWFRSENTFLKFMLDQDLPKLLDHAIRFYKALL